MNTLDFLHSGKKYLLSVLLAISISIALQAALPAKGGIEEAFADDYFSQHHDWDDYCMRAHETTVTVSQVKQWVQAGVLGQELAYACDLIIKSGPREIPFENWDRYTGSLYVDSGGIAALVATPSASTTVSFYMSDADLSRNYLNITFTVIPDPPDAGGNPGDGAGEESGGEAGEGSGNAGEDVDPSSPSDRPTESTKDPGDEQSPSGDSDELAKVTVDSTGAYIVDDSTPRYAGEHDNEFTGQQTKSPFWVFLNDLWSAITFSPITIVGFNLSFLLLLLFGIGLTSDIVIIHRYEKRKKEWLCSQLSK